VMGSAAGIVYVLPDRKDARQVFARAYAAAPVPSRAAAARL